MTLVEIIHQQVTKNIENIVTDSEVPTPFQRPRAPSALHTCRTAS